MEPSTNNPEPRIRVFVKAKSGPDIPVDAFFKSVNRQTRRRIQRELERTPVQGGVQKIDGLEFLHKDVSRPPVLEAPVEKLQEITPAEVVKETNVEASPEEKSGA